MTATITVNDELCDRLETQASRAGLTLGPHLCALADAADRRDRLDDLKRAIREPSATGRESHSAESQHWEESELTDAPRD